MREMCRASNDLDHHRLRSTRSAALHRLRDSNASLKNIRDEDEA